ncbi:MAG: TraE/TraK family type IV conjugative transfer system protein [Desulfobacteraceae bacterium]|jgi:type IV conjugative transfer system protein TraE
MGKNPYLDFKIKEKLLSQNRLLKLGFILSTIATMTMAVTNSNAIKKIRIEILPPTITDELILSNESINENGVVMFTRNVFDLFLNHTPKSAEMKFNEFMRLVQTESFEAVKTELEEELDRIKRLNIVSAFHIEEFNFKDNENDLVIVKGLRTKTSFGNKLGEKEYKVEEWGLRYKIANYNFKIVEIFKYD